MRFNSLTVCGRASPYVEQMHVADFFDPFRCRMMRRVAAAGNVVELIESPEANLLGQSRPAVARERRDACEPLLEGDAGLKASERLADALVIPAAHAQDPRDSAADIENFWVLEDRFVVVGRANNRSYHAARGYLYPGDLRVPKRLALKTNDRAIVPKALLERIVDKRQVFGENTHLLGVFEQAIQCQGEGLRRQIIAGDDAQLHESQRLTLGQSIAALRGLEQVRD